MSSITAADAVFILTVKDLFNAPIQLENWATDTMWDQQSLKIASTTLSIDGKLNKGFIPSAYEMTLHFSANSDSLIVFDTIATASRQARTVFELNGELSLKDLSRKYTFVSGCVTSLDMLPPGNHMLGNRKVSILWQDVLPAGL